MIGGVKCRGRGGGFGGGRGVCVCREVPTMTSPVFGKLQFLDEDLLPSGSEQHGVLLFGRI